MIVGSRRRYCQDRITWVVTKVHLFIISEIIRPTRIISAPKHRSLSKRRFDSDHISLAFPCIRAQFTKTKIPERYPSETIGVLQNWLATYLGDDSIPYHSIALASAVLLGKCTSDVTHVLSVPTVAMNEVVNVLRYTARLLDRHQNGYPYRHIPSFMGLVIEVYKWVRWLDVRWSPNGPKGLEHNITLREMIRRV